MSSRWVPETYGSATNTGSYGYGTPGTYKPYEYHGNAYHTGNDTYKTSGDTYGNPGNTYGSSDRDYNTDRSASNPPWSTYNGPAASTSYPQHIGDKVMDLHARRCEESAAAAASGIPIKSYLLDGQVDNRTQLPLLARNWLTDHQPWLQKGGHALELLKKVAAVHYHAVVCKAPGTKDAVVWPAVHRPSTEAEARSISHALIWTMKSVGVRNLRKVIMSVRHDRCGPTWPLKELHAEFIMLPSKKHYKHLYQLDGTGRGGPRGDSDTVNKLYVFQENSHYTLAIVMLFFNQYDLQQRPSEAPHFDVWYDEKRDDIMCWCRPKDDNEHEINSRVLSFSEGQTAPIDLPPRPISMPRRVAPLPDA